MFASVALLLIVGSHLDGIESVRSMRMKAYHNRTRVNTGQGWPECSNAKDWAMEKRSQGLHLPSQESYFNCRAGFVPTTNAYKIWTTDKKCGSFYVERMCKVRNEPHIQAIRTFKPIGFEGKCETPQFSMSDCTEVHEAVLRFDSAPSDVERQKATYALAEKVSSMTGLAPHNQWMQIPSHRLAVSRLAAGLEDLISTTADMNEKEYNRLVGRKLGPVWHVLLSYCADSASRAWNELKELNHKDEHSGLEAKANELGEDECKMVTKMDLFAHYHPAAIAAISNFENLDTLNTVGSFGLEYLVHERVWEQLAWYSGVTNLDAQSYQKLTQKKNELILNAGDRGEYELELALALRVSDPKLPEPLGGQRRLDEMKINHQLQTTVQNNMFSDKFEIKKLIRKADDLLEAGELQWVPVEPFMNAKRVCQEKIDPKSMSDKCKAVGLPPDCTQSDIDNVECTNARLPPGCTAEDIRQVQLIRQECIEWNFPEDCSSAELQAAKQLRDKCREHNLPDTCTEDEIANFLRAQETLRKLRKTCESLGIAEADCTQDHLDQREAWAQTCLAAGLKKDCTQEELDSALEAVEPEVVEAAPKPFCVVRERTSLKFDVQFAYHVKTRKCTKVTCAPYVFFENAGPISKLLSAKPGDKHQCTCFKHDQGTKEELFSFIHNDDCGDQSCVKEYAERMEKGKYPNRKLLKEQRFQNMGHWEAECVEEEQPIIMPEPPRVSKKKVGTIDLQSRWPSKPTKPKLADVVKQVQEWQGPSVANMMGNYE